MPIPATIADLSIVAGSNSPAGSESPSLLDDYQRSSFSFIAQLRDQTAYAPITIASAATTDIGSALSNVIYVTGTTTITALGTAAAGVTRTVRFLGALVLTHNATSLILPGTANITTAANDTAEFLSLGSGNWQCIQYVTARAVIERGSTGNGQYVRFGDGTQICWLNQPQSMAATTAAGPLFYASSSWTYPIQFSAAPTYSSVVSRVGGVCLSSGFVGNPTTTSVAFAVFDFISSTNTYNIQHIAIGRWF